MLEERRLLSCTIRTRGDTLTILGDGTPHAIRILDNGTASAGNITVACDGRTVVSPAAVRVIVLRTGAGDDHIRYNLTGNLGAGVQRVVDIMPGNGQNTFQYSLRGSLLPRSSLALHYAGGNGVDRVSGTTQETLQSQATLLLDLNGGLGNDRINVDASGTSIAPAANFVVDAAGDAGRDQIAVHYAGSDQGALVVRAAGGRGGDQVAADLDLTNMGTTIRGVVSAQVIAIDHRNMLRLTVHRTDPSSPLLLNPEINGGTGFDVCVHTAGVRVVSCEQDVVVP
jgi:hypothetical protein